MARLLKEIIEHEQYFPDFCLTAKTFVAFYLDGDILKKKVVRITGTEKGKYHDFFL